MLVKSFLGKIDFSEGCWEWNAGKDKDGYGWFYDGTLRSSDKPWNKKAHRVSLTFKLGREISPGMKVCHTCDNPSCVRPSHLYEGTQVQNEKDKVSRGRHKHASKTHCSKGHEYNEANTYYRPDGGRNCRVCDRESKRDKYLTSLRASL
jgi:hypothetical protein